MALDLTRSEAWLFLPFVLPICLWVIWSDLSTMKITNRANLALLAVFVLLGLLVIPLEGYLWRLAQFAIMLGAGILANMVGLMGAGDSKFLAVAAPFIVPGDYGMVLMLLMGVTFFAVLTHRLAKHSPLRQLAPHWESWHREGKFPFGLALGSTLACYLAMGALQGA